MDTITNTIIKYLPYLGYAFCMIVMVVSLLWGCRMYYRMVWFRLHTQSLLHIVQKLYQHLEVPLSLDDRAAIKMALKEFEKTKKR